MSGKPLNLRVRKRCSCLCLVVEATCWLRIPAGLDLSSRSQLVALDGKTRMASFYSMWAPGWNGMALSPKLWPATALEWNA